MIRKIVLCVICIVILSTRVNAAEYTYSMSDIGKYTGEEAWDKLIDSLPDNVSEEIIGIDPYSGTTVIDEVKEKASVSFWIEKLWNEIRNSTFGFIPETASITSMIILLSLSKIIMSNSVTGLSEAYTSFGNMAVVLSLFSATAGVIESASRHLTAICNIMNLLTPVMQAIYLAEGSLTQLSVSSTGVMLVVTAIGNINSHIMLPCTSMLFSLSAVSTVCDEVKINGFTELIRKFIMRTWQIITIGFSFMLGTQSIIARSADNLASKTVKFAIGSIIPMAGGVLAEAYNTIKEGISFVRSATGIGGIIVIILMLIPGIIPPLVYKLIINFTSMLSDSLGMPEISGFLNEVKGIIEIVVAFVLYTSLMLIFAVILFTRAQVG